MHPTPVADITTAFTADRLPGVGVGDFGRVHFPQVERNDYVNVSGEAVRTKGRGRDTSEYPL